MTPHKKILTSNFVLMTSDDFSMSDKFLKTFLIITQVTSCTKQSTQRYCTYFLTHTWQIKTLYYPKVNISGKLYISNINDFIVLDNSSYNPQTAECCCTVYMNFIVSFKNVSTTNLQHLIRITWVISQKILWIHSLYNN